VVSFKRSLKSGVAAICIAGLAAPAGFAETTALAPIAGAGLMSVRVAETADFSHLEFRFPGAKVTSRRDGQKLILHFSRLAKPDMARLRVDPPRWLKTADAAQVGGGLQLTLTLADGADAKLSDGDGATVVNLFSVKTPEPADAKASEAKASDTKAADAKTAEAKPAPALNRADPAPAGGVVKMQAEMSAGQVVLRFPWKSALGAAVFRRGDAVWVVFDAAARIDLSAAPHGFRQATSFRAVQGGDYSAVRIGSPPDVAVSARGEGGLWIVTLAPNGAQPPDAIKVTRDEGSPTPALSATVAGATKVVWLNDPVVGDRLGAVTARAPDKGLAAKRTFVDLTLLPTVQGLAIEPAEDDLTVSTDGDLVSIGRPKGLALSAASARAMAVDQGPDIPQATSRPGLVDFDNWSKLGDGGFNARYDALQAAAAAEATGGKDESVKARMGLARFLIGSELSFEGIGVLNMVARAHQNMLGDAEFRGLRGAAKVMAGRYKEASADLSSPAVADDPACSLWRGYIAAKLGQWTEARSQFAQGASALYQFSDKWRARFAREDAEAETNLAQYPAAESSIATALQANVDQVEQLTTRLTQAELFEAEGQKDRALHVFQVLQTVPQEWLAAPAMLHATEIQLAESKITPTQAASVYDGLRYRWRGDATELDTIRALGQIYLSLGRYREALEALRSAGQRLPDLPEAVALQADLNNAFRSLFLEGQADGLQPIQALALFYDFKELTPIGADGDQMVRRLARRLVDVDLLSQASELLKYQADNRLDGVPRAEVSTDLAMIDLMDRRPEDALQAINSSRTTLLPNSLNAQRRVIESRAWLQLGQYDHALEIIETDKGGDSDSIRAEVSWKKHDWASAGGLFEKMLGDRWKTNTPLTQDEEAKLLRAAIAYSLAGDDGGLTRVRGRFQGFVDRASAPDALRVALSGVSTVQLTSTDFTRASVENDSFAGWVQAMKQRFRDHPAPVSNGMRPTLAAAGGGPAKG
jgi:tetratricopeptide (TPR) repeat protein